ncbi:hypothetical protein M408DRAFT_9939 [Serendipita vermifera MAFF 305830]|uniref:Uncharacterized protein n=1 Tax=Serendipita vermifera MAFF 305830 TaxID=933852 RepID=A0A0C3B266_SERVB|nr:hypothetical protein M408DRAFT_9939 [Serendipita vermifera MAFF 305830]
MSPPPEEELREQESSGGSRKRARSPSPAPKARKFPKLQKSKISHKPEAREYDHYLVPLKPSQDASGKKSRGSEPNARSQSTAKAIEGKKSDSRRRSSPAPSRRGSVSHSQSVTPSRRASGVRPTTPIIIRTVPPPDINSLPPPAPPSPSDDPLWMPPPPLRRRPDGSILYSSRKKGDSSIAYDRRRASTSYRADSPTPASKSRPSASVSPLINMDDDVQMMDAEPVWEDNDVPSGTDFVVPLNFDSSGSPRPSMYSKSPTRFNASPRKATPVRGRPGSPWIRENVEDSGVQATWMPLQDAPSDSEDSDNDAEVPQESLAVPSAPVEISPVEAEDNRSPSLAPQGVDASASGGFASGKTLSQRFSELNEKLAAEGRSFREEPTFRRSLSAIGAMPSSDNAGDYDQPELDFPDLPHSSPEKAAEEPETSSEETGISASIEYDEEPVQQRKEDPPESGLNEYLSQDEEEETSPMEEPISQIQEQQPESFVDESHELSLQESAEPSTQFEEYSVPVADPSQALLETAGASWESSVAVDDVVVTQPQEEVHSEAYAHKEADSIRSPQANQPGNEDASFISPIRGNHSLEMDAASDDSADSDTDSEDEMDESGHAAESTYEQGSQQLSHDEEMQRLVQIPSIVVDEPQSTPGIWRRVSDEGVVLPEAKDDPTLQEEESIEDEMAHGPSWEDETDAEPLVQIRSNDPMAAARAAAILNLHHEYIQGTPKRQDSSSVWASSSRRRSTSVMHTPAFESKEPRSSQLFATPSRRGGDTGQLAPSPVIYSTSKSEWQRLETPGHTRVLLDWTKREWRSLEQCFTDVRMEAAQALDLDDIDPEEIDLDDVVARFVETYGVNAKLDGEWKWEKMRRRAYALINRQREGNARGLESAITSPTQSVFTPMRPTKNGPIIRAVPDPLGPTSTLHAPRYAHLAHERGVSQSPTPTQTRTGGSNRDMPPPSYLPSRPNANTRAQPAPQKLQAPPLPSKPYQIPPSTPLARSVVPEPTSASRKMWNWMGSFLRAGSEQPSESGEPREFIPSLPPISDADREALRHVSPPAPKPKERIIPPKDQVQLQHVPTPVPIRIPRKLNHKGSSGSVKDMIKSFESISETDSLRKETSRPFVIKKSSASSLRSMDSSSEWSREQSKSSVQEISVGSVRSVRDMVQNYSPATSQSASRVHVGSFRMGDGSRW